MILLEHLMFHFYDWVLRSNLSRNCGAVSPRGEIKRGEFRYLIPPPNPRQRGKSSDIAHDCTIKFSQSDFIISTNR